MQLADHYDDPIRQKLADLAFVISTDLDSPYETPGEALFAILVQGAAMYTDAWVADSIAHPSGSLADAIVEATDLADPSRAADPLAAHRTHADMALEAVRENLDIIWQDDGSSS